MCFLLNLNIADRFIIGTDTAFLFELLCLFMQNQSEAPSQGEIQHCSD